MGIRSHGKEIAGSASSTFRSKSWFDIEQFNTRMP